ncbi:MAG: hypothetical protein NXI04_05215 [Planctomycetaceae bacterium]|nr:hypothetical protein [Planctomycetaceae bacterium]
MTTLRLFPQLCGCRPTSSLVLAMAVLLSVITSTAQAGDANADAAAVKQIFRTRCLECHGDTRREADIHVMQRDSYVGDEKAVTPGDLDASYLFDLISTDDEDYRMPESPRPALSAAEIDTVRRWITAGAPPFSSGRGASRNGLRRRAEVWP